MTNPSSEERIFLVFTAGCSYALMILMKFGKLSAYQFIKHAFGLVHSPIQPGGVRVRLYPDKMPDTDEQVEKFKPFIVALSRNSAFRRQGVSFDRDEVAEVRSHDHGILQCLDIVLGAIQFRLNDKHKAKPEGKSRRGKRTIAKEAVYKHISRRIREIYPNFNIGITTGMRNDLTVLWADPYRHWRFVPSNRVVRPKSKK